MSCITISRQFGSLDEETAVLLSKKMNYKLYELEDIVSLLLSDIYTPEEQELLIHECRRFHNDKIGEHTVFEIFKQRLVEHCENHKCIFIGFGACNFLENIPKSLHVRIFADREIRIRRISDKYKLSETDAKKWLELSDRRVQRLVTNLHQKDINDINNYHLIISSNNFTAETLRDIIYNSYISSNIQENLQNPEQHVIVNTDEAPLLKNKSEIEFAKILDRYHIDWRYEPRTFPVEWDEAGRVTLAFSPDFYLPRFNLYLELTTMKQKYVSEKRKKLKKLHELYPDTNVRIVYKDDFSNMVKHLNLDLDFE